MARRILPAVLLVAGIVLGAGGTFLFQMLAPKPPPPAPPPPLLVSAWRLLPLSQQTPLPACKQGFGRAFQAAGLTEVAIEPGDGIQVLARANGYIALGMCMQRREIALVVVTGADVAVINQLLTAVTNAAMGNAPPAPAR